MFNILFTSFEGKTDIDLGGYFKLKKTNDYVIEIESISNSFYINVYIVYRYSYTGASDH